MRAFITVALILGLSLSVDAQSENTERKVFAKQLFTPAPISLPGLNETQFKDLNPEKKADLMRARETMIKFFTGLEDLNAPDPLTLLDPKLQKRFKDRTELSQKLLGEETSVVLLGLSSVGFINSQGIRLKFYILIFSEGAMLAREGSFDLKKLGREWKIADIPALGDEPKAQSKDQSR